MSAYWHDWFSSNLPNILPVRRENYVSKLNELDIDCLKDLIENINLNPNFLEEKVGIKNPAHADSIKVSEIIKYILFFVTMFFFAETAC
jgi:hypothetical protein